MISHWLGLGAFFGGVVQGLLPLEVTEMSDLMKKISMEKERKKNHQCSRLTGCNLSYWNARILSRTSLMEAQSTSHQKTATRLSEFALNCLVFVNVFTPQIWVY